MLKQLKSIPKTIIFGQAVFLLSIVIFMISLLNPSNFSSNHALLGLIAGCIIGILTSLVPENKDWKYIMFDIALTSFLFIAYSEVFYRK